MDLAKPEWKGRWAATPAGADFQAIVSAILELKGEAATLAWLKGMKENVVPFKGNSLAMKAVNAGQVDSAVIYHYYYYGDMAKTGENSEKVGQHYFRNEDPGAFVSISGGGVLASSKHKAEAQAFVKWITGKGGRKFCAQARRSNMPSDKVLPLTAALCLWRICSLPRWSPPNSTAAKCPT